MDGFEKTQTDTGLFKGIDNSGRQSFKIQKSAGKSRKQCFQKDYKRSGGQKIIMYP